ncbi:MAG: inositol monophosphatase [Bdellovibrionaceae bacterium]|nr:inositol monophosphatase [Pseudobdellovibrionaceae bacterium]
MNFQSVGPVERKELLRCALKAARLGREVLIHYFGRLEHIEEKFQAGLVSEADKESERVIRDYLSKQYPDFEFVGEESTLDLRAVQSKSARPRWILDPLDGTTNYIHRFPAFAVSLGLQVGDDLEVGVVDVPMMGEVYSAVRGGGAFVNGRKISVSGTSELKDAFLATGFISEIEENLEEQLRVFSNMVRKARAIRRAGAAAYDLCLVARGVFDGYWEKGIKPWDAAAGVLLVREAGGCVQTYRGKEYGVFDNSIVAGTKPVVKQVQAELAPYILASTN